MPSKLAAQLFTLREFTKTAADFDQTLAKVAAMGYPAVQISAVGCMSGATPEVSARDARQMLDRHGLRCVATHRDWNSSMNRTDEEIEFHRVLGCDFMAIGSMPMEFHTRGVEGYRDLVKQSRQFISKMKEAGLRWGYHNHSHEFVRHNGQRCYDILIDEAPRDFLLEIDTYWVAHAGCNPEAILRRCAGRIPVMHFKDMNVVLSGHAMTPTMAPVGEGNLDWDGIIRACEDGGTEWYCIEQDICHRDPFDCLKSSFDFLISKGL